MNMLKNVYYQSVSLGSKQPLCWFHNPCKSSSFEFRVQVVVKGM